MPLLAAGCGGLKLPRPLAPPEPARVKERSPSFTVTTHEGVEKSSQDFLGRALVVVAAEPGYVGDVVRWLRFIEGERGQSHMVRPKAEGQAPSKVRPALTGVGDSPLFPRLLAVVEGGARQARDLAPLLPEGVEPYADCLGVARMRAYCRSVELKTRADQVRKDEPERAASMEKEAERIDERLSQGTLGFRDAFGFVGEGPLVVVIGADGTLLCMIDGPPDGGRKEKLQRALDGLLGRE